MVSPSIAIVGAGFSGMAVAVQLLQRLRGPATVCLINRSHRFGRGMAYGTRSGSHLLNVPAGRMSVDPADADDFVRFLRAQGLACRPGDFVPRKFYGEYLEAALERAQRIAAGPTLRMLQAEVLDMQPAPDGGLSLSLDDGRRVAATDVVMALGNFPPRSPWAATPASGSVVNDPWSPAALDGLPSDASVLLAGSGLTAYDVVLSLLDRGHRGPITMLSRRGLLPHGHREQETQPSPGLVPADAMAGLSSARAQLREVRAMVRSAARLGADWRDVIGGLRPQTPRLWAQLDAQGRAQFVRHLLPYWDTHRHRAAPAIHQRIQDALAGGQLQVVAGRVVEVVTRGLGDVNVLWRPRGASQPSFSRFDMLVNCTGPSSDLRRLGDPLICRLREQGGLRVDPLGLGLEVDDSYRVLRADGTPHERVRYVGPLLRAQLWEATAVPELREHAARVSALLSAKYQGNLDDI
jgi:uncharacterized NAD(P)/FAD-binding protein YdhS